MAWPRHGLATQVQCFTHALFSKLVKIFPILVGILRKTWHVSGPLFCKHGPPLLNRHFRRTFIVRPPSEPPRISLENGQAQSKPKHLVIRNLTFTVTRAISKTVPAAENSVIKTSFTFEPARHPLIRIRDSQNTAIQENGCGVVIRSFVPITYPKCRYLPALCFFSDRSNIFQKLQTIKLAWPAPN